MRAVTIYLTLKLVESKISFEWWNNYRTIFRWRLVTVDSPKGGLQWLFQTTEEGAVRNELNIQINEGGGTRVCVVERGGGMMYWGQFYNSLTLCYLNKLLLPHSQNNSLEAAQSLLYVPDDVYVRLDVSRQQLLSSNQSIVAETNMWLSQQTLYHKRGNNHVTFQINSSKQ